MRKNIYIWNHPTKKHIWPKGKGKKGEVSVGDCLGGVWREDRTLANFLPKKKNQKRVTAAKTVGGGSKYSNGRGSGGVKGEKKNKYG